MIFAKPSARTRVSFETVRPTEETVLILSLTSLLKANDDDKIAGDGEHGRASNLSGAQ